MTHLNITQGSNVEIVSALIINKLYDTALTVSEPLEGELDNAYLSGNLWVGRASQNKVKYLAGTVLVRGVGNEYNNPEGRFLDLKINVTDEYYIDFADSEIERLLISGGFSSDGSGITISDAGSANIGILFKDNTTITSFPEFKYFTLANTTSATNGMFNNCTNLTTIDLSSCTTMRTQLFANSGIQTVNAPILSSISDLAFNHCTNLTTVSNLGYITSIPSQTFQNCTSLTSVNLPTNCTELRFRAFENCTSLPYINLDNVTVMDYSVFSGCTSLEINNPTLNITSTGNSAFYNTKLKGTLNCPSLTSLGTSVFLRTKLTTVECLGYILTVGGADFKECTNLTTVYIPYECTKIGSEAFTGCTNLTTIKLYNKSLSDYVEGETPVFNDISRVTYFGDGCFNSTAITGITNSIILNATNIGAGVCNGRYSSTTVNLPYSPNLGAKAFYNNPSITSVVFGDSNNNSCSYIGEESFKNCSNLQIFDIENTSITTIREEVVTGGNLTTVKLPTTLTTYGRSGHASPLNFKAGANVTITGLDGVSAIYGYISGCTVLNAIYMPSYISGYNSIIKYTENHRTYNTTIKQLYYPSFKYCTFESFEANQSVVFNNTFFAYRLRENDSTWVRVNTLYFKDLENIQPYMFYGCLPKNLVINNVTPPTIGTMPTCPASLLAVSTYPTWSTTLFGTIPTTGNDAMTIYVPDSAVSTYQANSYYSSYTILGISNLTKYATEALWEAAGRPDDCLIEEYMS